MSTAVTGHAQQQQRARYDSQNLLQLFGRSWFLCPLGAFPEGMRRDLADYIAQQLQHTYNTTAVAVGRVLCEESPFLDLMI